MRAHLIPPVGPDVSLRGEDHGVAYLLQAAHDQRARRLGVTATAELLGKPIHVDISRAAKRHFDFAMT
jgi:hypothetical protein